MERWIGRVAIVTGASSGIGAGIARLLAENGMKVVGMARREDRIKDLIKEMGKVKGELHAVNGDVTKEEDVVRVVKWTRDNLGGADVLVNNAGIFCPTPLTSGATTEDMKKLYDVNVIGLCVFTREVVKDMRSRGIDDGHIFHMNSVSGQRFVDFPGAFTYFGTKHSVRVLTEGLRRELRDLKTKIRVTSISPGLVRSDVMTANNALSQDHSRLMYQDNPSLEPLDIANALLYALCTPPHVQIHEITIQPVGEKF